MKSENEGFEMEVGEEKHETIRQKLNVLFRRVLDRGLEIRDDFRQKIVDADPERWNRIKEAPFGRSFAGLGEAALGAEPGKQLSGKESLVRSAVAALGAYEDFVLVNEDKKRGELNAFQGKTMRILSYLQEKVANGDSKKAAIASALFSFLSANPHLVSEAEEKIHSFLQRQTA